ncbi:MAG: hypothetical protein RLZ10_905 [Bacteroidota bacterium]|jgi:phosphoribosylglycinamide formyltransferase-1
MSSFQNLTVFISGTGTNAKNLIFFFQTHEKIRVSLVVSEKENVELEEICRRYAISYCHISKPQINDTNYLAKLCQDNDIHWVILAGYLKKIPPGFIEEYPDKIINIHPSLLPKYGGKGMYGNHVHQAVLDSKESTSGISIHLVNEEYDKGRMIAQFSIELEKNENLESLTQKIRTLEHTHFPKVIENHILQNG